MACTPTRIGTPQSVVYHLQNIRLDYLDHYPIVVESIQSFNGESFEIVEVVVEDHYIQPSGQHHYLPTEQFSAQCPHTTFLISLCCDWGSQDTRAVKNSDVIYYCSHQEDWQGCICKSPGDLIENVLRQQ